MSHLNAEFAAFRWLIETGSELDEQREQLLRPAAAGLPGTPRGDLVCSCHGVGAGDLRAAVAAGSDTLPELCAATRAGTGCGTCRPEVAAVLARFAGTPQQAEEPPAAACAVAEPSARSGNSAAAGLPELAVPPEGAIPATPEAAAGAGVSPSEPVAPTPVTAAARPLLAVPPASVAAATPEPPAPPASAVALPALVGPPASAGAAALKRHEPLAATVTPTAVLPESGGTPSSADGAALDGSGAPPAEPAGPTSAPPSRSGQPRGGAPERAEKAVV